MDINEIFNAKLTENGDIAFKKEPFGIKVYTK